MSRIFCPSCGAKRSKSAFRRMASVWESIELPIWWEGVWPDAMRVCGVRDKKGLRLGLEGPDSNSKARAFKLGLQ